MNARFPSLFRRCLLILIVLAGFLSTLVYPHPVVAAAVFSHSAAADKTELQPLQEDPQAEPTPTPIVTPAADASFNPDSVSITLIFKTILEWLMGKSLDEVFSNVELTEEQQSQIEALSGESNPINLVHNFCAQVRSGDFARMAESVRESNRDDGNGAVSPSILMDFFEQLGAFCPAE